MEPMSNKAERWRSSLAELKDASSNAFVCASLGFVFLYLPLERASHTSLKSATKEHGSAAVRVHWDYPPFAFQKNGGSGVTGEFAGFVWS
jgi:hypothetical protein